ncbi:hypothetical protein ERJ75_001188100 [Trypanosoma vivax]|uniref:Uncharacterized protein n=1 Tax=Trypanosoma vivax (strain Y486) TaxID=1055687 RepID=G0UC78_TRYVY|nr:hypothetical protein ERJ75_001188100 [Trypanosoma vivax]CCC53428.1 conserved hypothetical protein [Trypanosoma vivax Y486]
MSQFHSGAAEALDVQNAKNVRYTLRDKKHLVLLVDLASRGALQSVAHARGVPIGDLPVSLLLVVGIFGTTAGKGIVEAGRETVTELVEVGPNTRWMVEGTTLKIIVDLSDGPLCSASGKSGSSVVLASVPANMKLFNTPYRVNFKLMCNSGVEWPMLLSPRTVSKSMDRANSPHAIPRELRYSLSPSVAREGDGLSVAEKLMPLSDYIALDESKHPFVRLLVDIKGTDGKGMRFEGKTPSGINITLSLQRLSSEDAKQVTSLAAQTSFNVSAFVDTDATGREFLVIEMDVSKPSSSEHHDQQSVASVLAMRVGGDYVLNFTATDPTVRLPSFEEMYKSVCRLLDPVPDSLPSLNMDAVRSSLMPDVPDQHARCEINNIIWEAVRLYVFEHYASRRKQKQQSEFSVTRVV